MSAPGDAPVTLPRRARLTQSRQFNRVFASASRVRDQYFTILFRPSEVAEPRLGMAVSRRNAPKATDRSRIKRIVRETFRHRRAMLGPCDIVVIAKPSARQAERAQLQSSLNRLWQKIARQWSAY